MTSRNLVAGKILLSGALCLGLAACNGASHMAQQNRAGFNGVNGTSFGNIQVAPNGSYTVSNVNCNASDNNVNDIGSPLNPNSPCSALRNQANGQVPQQQYQQTVQPQQQQMGPAVNPSLPPGQGGPGPMSQQQIQQQGPQVYPTGNISKDIGLDGRIRGAMFQLRSGAGEETITDNCFNGTGYDGDGTILPEHEYRAARFLKSGDVFKLTFDSRGGLLINAKSETGAFSSNGPVPYQLDADAQTIHIGYPDEDKSITLSGPTTQTYAEHEDALAKIVKRVDDIDLKKALSITGNLPNDSISGGGSGNSGSTGFVLGPQAGSSDVSSSSSSNQSSSDDCASENDHVSGHSNVTNSGGAGGSTPGAPTGITLKKSSNGGLADELRHSTCSVHSSSQMTTYSSRNVPNRNNFVFSGITGNIKVHPNQQQHIVAIVIDTLNFQGHAFVKAPVGLPCEPTSVGDLHHIVLE